MSSVFGVRQACGGIIDKITAEKETLRHVAHSGIANLMPAELKKDADRNLALPLDRRRD